MSFELHGATLLRTFVIAITLLVGSTKLMAATTSDNGDEPQWLYRDNVGGRGLAIFLDSGYQSVLFRAWCDSRFLVIDYFGDGVVKLTEHSPMELVLSDGSYRMTVAKPDFSHSIEGRIRLSPPLIASIAATKNIDISAPNEEEESWHVGHADALRRVLKSCH